MISLIAVGDVSASEVTIECRVRDKPRSEIIVRGNDFRPWKKKGRRKIKIKYFAVVYSGSLIAQAAPKPPTSSRQLEFYFDSNASDLRPGDTQIPANFIANNQVTAEIRLQGVNTKIADMTATCRIDD